MEQKVQPKKVGERQTLSPLKPKIAISLLFPSIPVPWLRQLILVRCKISKDSLTRAAEKKLFGQCDAKNPLDEANTGKFHRTGLLSDSAQPRGHTKSRRPPACSP